MLSEAIDRANRRHNWRLTAFVYMPEHVHLLVYPLPMASGVDRLLKAIKRPFSYRIKQRLIAANSPLLQKLTIKQRPGIKTFRFWQEGSGYDRNLESEEAVLASIDYIHHNPVRRKLCNEAVNYRWSSARFYAADKQTNSALPTLSPIPAEWFSLS